MLTEWIGKLLGRRRPPPPPSRPTPGRGVALEEVVDLRSLAEYDLNARGPLSADDSGRLPELQERTIERFLRSARTGLPFPDLARRLIQRGGGRKDVNSLVQLVQQEPVLSAQILRTANSAVHAERGEARGIREAVMRLGPDTAWQLALAAALLAVAEQDVRSLEGGLLDSWHEQWAHAMVVGSTAGWLSVTEGRGDVERLFLAGLLHDIGKIFALYSLSDLLREDALGAPLSPPLLQALLEGVHVDIGRELTAHWKLPSYIGAVCAQHHDERPGPDSLEVHVVRVVSGLDEIRRSPFHRQGAAAQVLASAAALGLDAMRLRALIAQLRLDSARAGS